MSRFEKPPIHAEEQEEVASIDERIRFIEQNASKAREVKEGNPALARAFFIHVITKKVNLDAPMSKVHTRLVSESESIFGKEKTEWPLSVLTTLLPQKNIPAGFLNEIRQQTEAGQFDLVETLALAARTGISQSLYLRDPKEDIVPPDDWSTLKSLREAVELHGLPIVPEDILDVSAMLVHGIDSTQTPLDDMILILSHSRPTLAMDSRAYAVFLEILKASEQDVIKNALLEVGLSPPFSKAHLTQLDMLARAGDSPSVWEAIEELQQEFDALPKTALTSQA